MFINILANMKRSSMRTELFSSTKKTYLILLNWESCIYIYKIHCSKRNINIFKIETNFDWREKLVYQIIGWEEMNLKNLMKMTRKIIKVILCQLYRETSLFNILAVMLAMKKKKKKKCIKPNLHGIMVIWGE